MINVSANDMKETVARHQVAYQSLNRQMFGPGDGLVLADTEQPVDHWLPIRAKDSSEGYPVSEAQIPKEIRKFRPLALIS